MRRVRDRVPAILLAAERWLRTHPGRAAIFSLLCFVALATAHVRAPSELSLALTYSFPLAICTYGVGAIAGVVTAVAVSLFWFLDALERELPGQQAAVILFGRLVGSLSVVALSAVAATAARARDRYVEGQKELLRLRGDLVSAFSHDVRGPLTAISGYLELLSEGAYGPLGTDAFEVVGRIQANATRLDHLIGDMLLAGDNDRALPLQLSTFTPADLLSDLRAEFDLARRNPAVALTWHVPPGALPFHTDRPKLTSIVRNLVSNALKFTTEGEVTVRITSAAPTEGYRIDVEDTGPGIAPSALPQVFDRFFRAATSVNTPGVGLGLFIVKRFTEVLGGTVAVSSRLGAGTKFTVTMPQGSPSVALTA